MVDAMVFFMETLFKDRVSRYNVKIKGVLKNGKNHICNKK